MQGIAPGFPAGVVKIGHVGRPPLEKLVVELVIGFVRAILEHIGSVVVVRAETRRGGVWMWINRSDGQANGVQARLRNDFAWILLMRHGVENLKGLSVRPHAFLKVSFPFEVPGNCLKLPEPGT